MDHHGPSIRRIACLHTPQEGQNGSRVLGYPVVRPGHELELSHLALLVRAILQTQRSGRVHIRKVLDSLGSLTEPKCHHKNSSGTTDSVIRLILDSTPVSRVILQMKPMPIIYNSFIDTFNLNPKYCARLAFN